MRFITEGGCVCQRVTIVWNKGTQSRGHGITVQQKDGTKDVAKWQRICSVIDSWCERDLHVPRLSWSTKVPEITPA